MSGATAARETDAVAELAPSLEREAVAAASPNSTAAHAAHTASGESAAVAACRETKNACAAPSPPPAARHAAGTPVVGAAQPAEAGAGPAPLEVAGCAHSVRFSSSVDGSPGAGSQTSSSTSVRSRGCTTMSASTTPPLCVVSVAASWPAPTRCSAANARPDATPRFTGSMRRPPSAATRQQPFASVLHLPQDQKLAEPSQRSTDTAAELLRPSRSTPSAPLPSSGTSGSCEPGSAFVKEEKRPTVEGAAAGGSASTRQRGEESAAAAARRRRSEGRRGAITEFQAPAIGAGPIVAGLEQ